MGEQADSRGRVPFVLRVGVVGHRSLGDSVAIGRAAAAALEHLSTIFPGTAATPVVFCALSALAEGADRILAHEVLRRPGSTLEAVLPLPADEYREDFRRPDSKTEFSELLAVAIETTSPPWRGDREEAYQLVGRLVVDRADVLIAVWDGRDTGLRAGTAPAVARARAQNTPLIVIDPADAASWWEELGGGLPVAEFAEIDHFNRARLASDLFSEELRARLVELNAPNATWASSLIAWQLPLFVRADLLATRYRRRHTAASDALFSLAAGALIVVAAQVLFFENRPEIAWIEVAMLLALLTLLIAARRQRLHDRWVTYRFLAERLRGALFVATVAGRVTEAARSEAAFGPRPEELWLKRAFEQVWRARPIESVAPSDAVDAARQFVLDGWVNEQATYYAASAARSAKRLQRLEIAGVTLFACTVVFAAVHALGLGHSKESVSSWATLATLLTIALPAVGVALAGVRTQRDHERNTLRFISMSRTLEVARERLERPVDMERLRLIVSDIDADLLDENRDWLLSILIRGRPQLGA